MCRMRVGRSASGGLGAAGAGAGASATGAGAAGVGTSAGAGEGASPPAARRAKPPPPRHPGIDLTVFRVPGLHLKVHYESKTLPEESTTPQTVPSMPPLNLSSRKVGTKKAALFAWITLQSIPEETIISPHILEFLEQTLEPIPTKASFSTPTPDSESLSRGRSMAGASYGQYVYASFPVDVIVHFHMQPSAFRFSCLPASRVECLLQLPSLQIVFSSKRAQDEEMAEPAVAMGGLSVTGCLADFSVYIFHPYGGKKSSVKEAQWSPLSDTERKDSLSINVEFVKFHLSRSRKLDFQTDQDQSKATVRFSIERQVTPPPQPRLRRRHNLTPFERATNEFVAIEEQRLQLEENRDRRLHEREVERERMINEREVERERMINERELEHLRVETERLEIERVRNEILQRLAADIPQIVRELLLVLRSSINNP